MTKESRDVSQVPAPPDKPDKSALPEDIGKPTATRWSAFVQTEREAHEAWVHLIRKKPRAAMVMHKLVANMGSQNAVVVSQRTLAKMLEIHERTVRRAIRDLEEGRWIQVVKIGAGREAAYVINDRVAWAQKRGMRVHVSLFSAQIIADADDQPEKTLKEPQAPLRRIPVLYPGEHQVPHGPGENPPSQAILEGMEPDLPTRNPPEEERAFYDEFMSRGPAKYPELPGDPGEEGETK